MFFAFYRDLVGTDELEVELPEGSTVNDLASMIRRRPGAADLPEAPVAAVNQEYVAGDTELRDGDEVAFIPPVAGG